MGIEGPEQPKNDGDEILASIESAETARLRVLYLRDRIEQLGRAKKDLENATATAAPEFAAELRKEIAACDAEILKEEAVIDLIQKRWNPA